jgi:hypothetical protein
VCFAFAAALAWCKCTAEHDRPLFSSAACSQITLPAATSPTQTTLSRIPLPYKPDALEPAIDTLTMNLHWGRHYQVFFTNLNTALANRTDLRALGITGGVCEVCTSAFPKAVLPLCLLDTVQM